MSVYSGLFEGVLEYKSQFFTSSGTWVRPAGVEIVYVTATGGGGAGAQSNGGSSGEAILRLPKVVSGNLSITIGAGGASGGGSSSSDGSATTVGDITLRGGSGTAWRQDSRERQRRPVRYGSGPCGVAYGGYGYWASAADGKIWATCGNDGRYPGGIADRDNSTAGGGGGGGMFGPGGDGATGATTGGSASANSGAGGGGGGSTGVGGAGGSGAVLIEWFE